MHRQQLRVIQCAPSRRKGKARAERPDMACFHRAQARLYFTRLAGGGAAVVGVQEDATLQEPLSTNDDPCED